MLNFTPDEWRKAELALPGSAAAPATTSGRAGEDPISQLAFTLCNGLTIVEYYLARGMHIDEFAPNLSFFFSNGMDPEYTVIGRVARRIWARAMRERGGVLGAMDTMYQRRKIRDDTGTLTMISPCKYLGSE